jgi:hypothetical protein
MMTLLLALTMTLAEQMWNSPTAVGNSAPTVLDPPKEAAVLPGTAAACEAIGLAEGVRDVLLVG